MIVVLSALLGVALTANPVKLLAAAVIVILGSAFFALDPERLMPGWLQAISKVNPLSYEVGSLRGAAHRHARAPAAGLVAATVLGITVSSLLLPR